MGPHLASLYMPGAPPRTLKAVDAPPSPVEFSGTIVKQINGKPYRAQIFAKGDRLRLEYTYALRTEYGYAAIEIIRPDYAETWYLLAQQKELLVTPFNLEEVLPIRVGVAGRTTPGSGG